MLRPILTAWYAYAALMAVLVALSAGPRTRVGWLALLAAAASGALLVSLFVLLPVGESAILGAKVLIALAALAALIRGPRTDTRLIALFLLVAAGLPLFLHFYQPPAPVP